MTARRPGFTILEMVLVSVISMVILAMAVGITGLMVGVTSVSHRQLDTQRALERLSHLFREDVHRAIGVTVPDKMQGASLEENDHLLCELTTAAGDQVRYRVSRGLLREKLQAGKIVAVEAFPLDPRYRIKVFRIDSHGKPLIGLTMQMQILDLASGRLVGKERLWQVVACLGRDLSQVPRPEKSEKDKPD